MFDSHSPPPVFNYHIFIISNMTRSLIARESDVWKQWKISLESEHIILDILILMLSLHSSGTIVWTVVHSGWVFCWVRPGNGLFSLLDCYQAFKVFVNLRRGHSSEGVLRFGWSFVHSKWWWLDTPLSSEELYNHPKGQIIYSEGQNGWDDLMSSSR